MSPNLPQGNTERNWSSVHSVKDVDESAGVIVDYVNLKTLPEFRVLSDKVDSIVQSSTWWELYGVDAFIFGCAMLGWFGSHFMLASSDMMVFAVGVTLLGFCHTIINLKTAHSAIHNAMCQSKSWNSFWSYICSDIIGTFSADAAYNMHIKCHHPHTNIIGLGDSNTWKAPFVPNFLYMFVTPLLLPVLSPLVALKEISSETKFKIIRHLVLAYGGLAFHLYLLMVVSQLSLSTTLLVVFMSRDVLAIPYIHVNIFQHIGLPMYSQKHRPRKIYQMTTGVLNLSRNPILDICFGNGINSCHVEHHLFPRLSDNMCLKVQPVVRRTCQELGLPYHEDSYTARMWLFLTDYKRLMVNAPPITKFVGLQ